MKYTTHDIGQNNWKSQYLYLSPRNQKQPDVKSREQLA